MKIFISIVLLIFLSAGYSTLDKEHKFYLDDSNLNLDIESRCKEPEKFGDIITVKLEDNVTAKVHVQGLFHSITLTGPPIIPLFPTFGDSNQDKRYIVRASFNKLLESKPYFVVKNGDRYLLEDNKRYEHLERTSSDFFKFVFFDDKKELPESITLILGLDSQNLHQIKLIRKTNWSYSPFIYANEKAGWPYKGLPPC